MTQQHSLFVIIKNEYQSRLTYELKIYILKSLRDVLFLAIEFFIENTAIHDVIQERLISSFSHHRLPLRDLAYEFLDGINAKKIAYIGYELSIEQIAIIWVLFCCLNGRQGVTILQKGVRCLTIARGLRVCLFSMTILPSPKAWCDFEGPINPFKAHVGGVCNDLLYSGHVTVYTLIGIAFTILSRKYSSRKIRYTLPVLVWFYMLQRIICTILERHHYSIDMFLGFIVTLLIWQCQILHIDLPKVPENLFLHLKQLFYPKKRPILKEV